MRRVGGGWRPGRLVLPAATAIVTAWGCATPAPEGPSWLLLDGEGFEILSARDPETTRRVARQLQVLRAVVGASAAGDDAAPAVPLRIVLFTDPSALEQVVGEAGRAGHLVSSMREDRLLLAEPGRAELGEAARHHLVHRFLARRDPVAYPFWYKEGFAEMLSSASVEGDQVLLGHYPERSIEVFRGGHWIPLDQLLRVAHAAELVPSARAMAFAESWALVHYLHYERGDPRTLRAQLARYLEAKRDGNDDAGALAKGFGIGVDELDRELRDYVSAGQFPYFSIPAASIETASPAELRALAPAEAATRLGRLALASGNAAAAESRFSSALHDSPDDPDALCGLASLRSFQGRWPEADELYHRAIAQRPNDGGCYLDFGESIYQRARGVDDSELTRALAETARKLLVRSWQLDPDVPLTYAVYGATFLLGETLPESGRDALAHASELLPSNLEIALLLAEYRARLGDPEAARKGLLSALAWAHEEGPHAAAAHRMARELGAPR